MVTKDELRQYKSLLIEVKYLQNKIEASNYSFVGKTGINLVDKRNNKLSELVELENRIHDFIYSIEDSEIRLILSMHYIDGLSQEKIGEKLNMDRSGVSRRITRILEEVTNEDIK